MKKTNLLLASSVAIGLLACQNPSESMNDNQASEQILTWSGVYKGTLPCADCSGIKTTLKLKQDKTYEKYESYLGKDNSNFQEEGTFTVTDDGKKIILTDNSQNKTQYAVGENQLILLDQEGKQSTSPLADQYRLYKLQYQINKEK